MVSTQLVQVNDWLFTHTHTGLPLRIEHDHLESYEASKIYGHWMLKTPRTSARFTVLHPGRCHGALRLKRDPTGSKAQKIGLRGS